MGAAQFFVRKVGQYRDAKDAFLEAKEEYAYEYGHGGYTGTIAEKNDFKRIEVPKGKDPYEYAQERLDAGDGFWDDKWGPAACVEVDGKYLQNMRGERWKSKKNFKAFFFFGWASE